jgi:hypothetical protein
MIRRLSGASLCMEQDVVKAKYLTVILMLSALEGEERGQNLGLINLVLPVFNRHSLGD